MRHRPYTVTLNGRSVARTVGAVGRPRIDWYAPGDILQVGWLAASGRWYEHRLAPGEELLIEQEWGHGRERHYTLTILRSADDDDVAGSTPVVCRSDTRPRITRLRDSRWRRLRLTDMTYGRRHVAYLRSGDGVVITQ